MAHRVSLRARPPGSTFGVRGPSRRGPERGGQAGARRKRAEPRAVRRERTPRSESGSRKALGGRGGGASRSPVPPAASPPAPARAPAPRTARATGRGGAGEAPPPAPSPRPPTSPGLARRVLPRLPSPPVCPPGLPGHGETRSARERGRGGPGTGREDDGQEESPRPGAASRGGTEVCRDTRFCRRKPGAGRSAGPRRQTGNAAPPEHNRRHDAAARPRRPPGSPVRRAPPRRCRDPPPKPRSPPLNYNTQHAPRRGRATQPLPPPSANGLLQPPCPRNTTGREGSFCHVTRSASPSGIPKVRYWTRNERPRS